MLLGWVVFLTSLLYIGALFLIAHWADTRGRECVSRAWPTVYALALAVYCTSWTFYGSVGLAAKRGFEFLTIYIGPILLFGLCFPLLLRVARIAKAQNITSLADFMGARYGRNQAVAVAVTIIAVVGSLPYVALQLKAVSVSLGVILTTQEPLPNVPTIFSGDMSFLVACALALFAILFGTRQIDATEHQPGLIFAIAVESVVKLIAFVAVGLFVTFGLFSGPVDLFTRAASDAAVTTVFGREADVSVWFTMIALAFFCALLLPRQFHVAIVENRHDRDVRRAAWLFPVYLLLINLFVAPIAIAGLIAFPTGAVDGDTFVIALPLSAGSSAMAIVAFIGGLSAATAMVIVASVALSIMISNEIVVPALIKAGVIEPERTDMGRLVILVRRLSVAGVIALAFLYYRYGASQQALAQIGLISFAAIAQLAPAFFGGLFWREATARGALAGLVVGFAVWTYTLLLPSLAPSWWIPAAWLTEGPFGLDALRPTQLFGVALDPLSHGVLWSLFANGVVFVLVSLSREPRESERLQAARFVPAAPAPNGPGSRRFASGVTVGALHETVARYLGGERSERSFLGFAATRGLTRTDTADAHVLRRAEHLLASAIGAASSRLVLMLHLRRLNVSTTDAQALLDGASAAIEYNRGLLQSAIDEVGQGIAVVDADLALVTWNRGFRDITGCDDIVVGRALPDVLRVPRLTDENAEALHVAEAFGRPGETHRIATDDGRRLELRTAALPDGGHVVTLTDVTEQVRAAEVLARTNEVLEQRVRERTEELERLNAELAAAKAKADEANAGKTRFLAAAGHDILQPLNAARLYASSLVERDMPGEQRQLVANMDHALEAVEDIIGALLDISRLDAGALKPQISVFPLRDVLSMLEVEFRPIAAEKGLDLVVVDCDLSVRSDKRLLRRLLQNLVSNAIKYTSEGKVLVGVRRRGTALRVEVRDTGQGIPRDQQAAIFQEFRRLAAGARVASGLGLGLSIVERIARVLDHPLAVSSEPGRGSCFALSVPRARAKARTPSEAPAPAFRGTGDLDGLPLLVIDNDAAIRDGMELLLGGWGADVVSGHGGEEALAAAQAQGFVPQVVICDLHLDTGNGFEAIQGVRERFGADLPAVLITADRSADLRAAAEAADITLLHKPLKPAALRAVLTRRRAQAAAE